MIAVERMVAAGLDPESAVDAAIWFFQQGNESDLEKFVMEVERRAGRGA